MTSIRQVVIPNVSWLGHLSGVIVGLLCISQAAFCYMTSEGGHLFLISDYLDSIKIDHAARKEVLSYLILCCLIQLNYTLPSFLTDRFCGVPWASSPALQQHFSIFFLRKVYGQVRCYLYNLRDLHFGWSWSYPRLHSGVEYHSCRLAHSGIPNRFLLQRLGSMCCSCTHCCGELLQI